MGGNNAQTDATALAKTQANTGQQFVNLAQQQLANSSTLEQPLINFYSQIASNNPGASLTAASPLVGQISQNTQQSEQNIMNNVPVGAGQDAASAQARIQQGQQTAQTLNQTYTGALSGLAQIGAAQAGVGLSEAGAGLSGMSGAQSAYGTQEQAQATEKAGLMSSIGSIVGGVGGGLAGNLPFSSGAAAAPSYGGYVAPIYNATGAGGG